MKTTRLFVRALQIGGLALLLTIPLWMVRGLVQDRVAHRQEAIAQVSRSTAGSQQLVGPVRVVPYTQAREVTGVDAAGVTETRIELTRGRLLQPPRALEIDGQLTPDARRIGLHEVRIYEWKAKAKARFDAFALPEVPGRTYEEPYVVVGVGDVRGLVGGPSLRADGTELALAPGTLALSSRMTGMHAPLPIAVGDALPQSELALDLTLLGTQTLGITPIADTNDIALSSSWPHPLFGGSFLPNQREIDAAGFRAHWAISSLASSARDSLLGTDDFSLTLRRPSTPWETTPEQPFESVDVSLADPVDVYTQTDRATKYGFLFVVLTFVAFALFELLARWPIHPLQYLLVGLALAIFFLLLLGLSEHLTFAKAYAIAATACIGLQLVYLSGILGSRVRAGLFSTMLTALYGVLYAILLSEDNALLMGSLLLFGILATIMWLTRKLDWYALGTPPRTMAAQPSPSATT